MDFRVAGLRESTVLMFQACLILFIFVSKEGRIETLTIFFKLSTTDFNPGKPTLCASRLRQNIPKFDTYDF